MEKEPNSSNGSQQALTKTATLELMTSSLWASIHAISLHWQSDLKFFQDELQFFRLLIDKHLALLIEPKNVSQTRKLIFFIEKLEKNRTALADDISMHVQHIVNLVQNPFAQDGHQYHDEHGKLEEAVAGFMKRFRYLKAEVFTLTEQVIRSERAKRMIDWA